MTDQEINIAIAEACGWIRMPLYDISNPQSSTTIPQPTIGKEAWQEPVTERIRRTHDLPNYCNDLNAMHEAEKTLPITSQQSYQDHLVQIAGVNSRLEFGIFNFLLIHATARQRAEAFLKTIGRWKG